MSDPARQLEQLLAAERGRPDPSEAHAQRVWARVEGRLDGRVPAPTWAQSSTFVAWPWLLVGCGVIVTLALLGPLVRTRIITHDTQHKPQRIGLADFPT